MTIQKTGKTVAWQRICDVCHPSVVRRQLIPQAAKGGRGRSVVLHLQAQPRQFLGQLVNL
jgi:hypothetical protein